VPGEKTGRGKTGTTPKLFTGKKSVQERPTDLSERISSANASTVTSRCERYRGRTPASFLAELGQIPSREIAWGGTYNRYWGAQGVFWVWGAKLCIGRLPSRSIKPKGLENHVVRSESNDRQNTL